jgi:hypothetical protein
MENNEEFYYPRGSVKKIAIELKGKTTYNTVKAYCKGRVRVSQKTIDLIGPIAVKYYKPIPKK